MKKETKKIFTKEQREKILADYQASKGALTIDEFVKKAGLPRSTFTGWLTEQNKAAKTPKAAAVAEVAGMLKRTDKEITKAYYNSVPPPRTPKVEPTSEPILARVDRLEREMANLKKLLVGG